MMPDPKQFNVEHQYQLWLSRMKLVESELHPVQKIQLRQAFFGAWGQSLLCMRDDVAALSDVLAVAVMESMIKQIETYWQNEVERYNAENQ